MKIIVAESYGDMSKKAGEMLVELIKGKSDCVLGLATGETPIGMYDYIAEAYNRGEIDMSAVSSINLDEYYPISPDNDQSYRYFMNKYLFDRVNIDKANTSVPDGQAKDVEAFCAEYESRIDACGGVDIQVLGIGRNGHIGFNEPAQELSRATHLTELTEDTIEANSRFFETADMVPRHALTMGVQSVFKAKRILLLASGESKAEAIRAMVKGEITTSCPATLLCLHHDVTLICDKAAYSLVEA